LVGSASRITVPDRKKIHSDKSAPTTSTKQQFKQKEKK